MSKQLDKLSSLRSRVMSVETYLGLVCNSIKKCTFNGKVRLD